MTGLVPIGEMLTQEAEQFASHRQWRRAARSYHDALAYGCQLRRKGNLVATLQGNAVQAMALKSLASRARQMDGEAALMLLQVLKRLRPVRGNASESLQQEREWGSRQLAEALRERKSLRGVLRSWDMGFERIVGIEWEWQFRFQPKRAVFQTFRNAMEELAKEAALPHGRRRFGLRAPPSDIFNQLIVSVYYGVANAHTRRDAYWEIAEAQLAIASYSSQNQGRLPSSLSELVPRYIPNAPQDPFSTGPLLYQPKGSLKAPLIYSVGMNGRDDGGKLLPYSGPATDKSDLGVLSLAPH